jgi:DNA-binding NarL/FixJ family response regulator
VARAAVPTIGSMSTGNRTSIYIVEDMPAMRDRLAELVGEICGVDVVGTAATPADAIAGVLRSRPDCVLLDYQLDGGTGLEVLRAVHPQAPEIVFVVLTNHAQPQYRRACLAAGARHFLDKSTEVGLIRQLVEHMDSPRH